MIDIRNQQRFLLIIAAITIVTLHIPLFILLNQQDNNYETIRKGVALEGANFIF